MSVKAFVAVVVVVVVGAGVKSLGMHKNRSFDCRLAFIHEPGHQALNHIITLQIFANFRLDKNSILAFIQNRLNVVNHNQIYRSLGTSSRFLFLT